jgi:streptogramin lyase
VIDQIDPNDILLLNWADGKELRRIKTRALHSSGITFDPTGNIWIASTFSHEVICFDQHSGKELVAYPTPPYDKSGGAHGSEWRDGKLWFNVPKTGRIFVMEPATGKLVHSIPCYGDRAHGIAWDPYDQNLWCVDTNKRVIFKLNPYSGQILDAVGCTGPEPHGMTIWENQFWICDAASRDVCVFDVPKP